MATKAQLEETIKALQNNVNYVSGLYNAEKKKNEELQKQLEYIQREAPYQNWLAANGEFVARAISEYLRENLTVQVESHDRLEAQVTLLDNGTPISTGTGDIQYYSNEGYY